MTYSLSPGLIDSFPWVDNLFARVRRVACRLDRDICVRDLRVEAQCNAQPEFYRGLAYPVTRRYVGTRATYHADGLIRLYIGARCDEEDIICLFAHELRHIGQFHRGRQRYGAMTVDPLSNEDSEADAHDFELRVLDRV